MDVAVGLVQTYLRVNGYFTVTEFPVVEAIGGGGYRAATDIDVLGCRFPSVADGGVGAQGRSASVDPELEIPLQSVDMIVGEVKESEAAFNAPGLRRDVLATTLARFGCCPVDHAEVLVTDLLATGHSTTPGGHHVRLVAFGATPAGTRRYTSLPLPQVVTFLEGYVRQNWQALKTIPSKDPALGWLILREKLRLAGEPGAGH